MQLVLNMTLGVVFIQLRLVEGVKGKGPSNADLRRARGKAKALCTDGTWSFYVEDRPLLRATWRALAAPRNQAAQQATIRIPYLRGVPALPGVTVRRAWLRRFFSDTVGYLSVDTEAAEIARWNPNWLTLLARRHLNYLFQRANLDEPELTAIWHAAAAGRKIDNMPIHRATERAYDSDFDGKSPWQVVIDTDKGIVVARIYRVPKASTLKIHAALMRAIHAKIAGQPVQTRAKYRVLERQVQTWIAEAKLGPERFDINLPFDLLVGVENRDVTDDQNTFVSSEYPGKGLLKVGVSEDGLQAKIDIYYEDEAPPDFAPSEDWLRRELQRQGVVNGLEETALKGVVELLRKKKMATGTVIAQGQPANAGSEPYLAIVLGEDSGVRGDQFTKVDMRKQQQRSIAAAQQKIAVVRYRNPATIGKDVLGRTLSPPSGPTLEVVVGDGVRAGATGEYYATASGRPVFADNVLSLSTMVVHEGNVNYVTGDIYHDGSLEITGSIDVGASVEVTGDLLVRKAIRGRSVKCGGKLVVEGGIVTAGKGRVSGKSEIMAGFIQDSHVTSRGNITAQKGIIGSTVIAGGDVRTTDPSSGIFGGFVASGNNIETFNLGRPSSPITKIMTGVDSQRSTRIAKLQRRADRIQAFIDRERSALKYLGIKTIAQKTKARRQSEEILADMVRKADRLLKRLRKSLQETQDSLAFNTKAKIEVKGILSTNCTIEVGGTPIPVPVQYSEVLIRSKLSRGGFISPLKEETAATEDSPK